MLGKSTRCYELFSTRDQVKLESNWGKIDVVWTLKNPYHNADFVRKQLSCLTPVLVFKNDDDFNELLLELHKYFHKIDTITAPKTISRIKNGRRY